MAIPKTIEEDIEAGVNSQRSHRVFNGSLLIDYEDTGESVRVPINPLISKYKDYFDPYIKEVELTEEEQNEYRFAPKKFSQDMYGTIHYWSMLLYINECHSIIEFEPVILKYIAPESINEIINEILILENLV